MTAFDHNPTRFFGEPYPRRGFQAPIFDGATEIPTPVGEKCYRCQEAIEEGDRGFLRQCLDSSEANDLPIHYECDLRSVLGSVAHLEGRCGCGTGNFDQDDDAEFATPREAARAVVAWLEKNGGTT